MAELAEGTITRALGGGKYEASVKNGAAIIAQDVNIPRLNLDAGDLVALAAPAKLTRGALIIGVLGSAGGEVSSAAIAVWDVSYFDGEECYGR